MKNCLIILFLLLFLSCGKTKNDLKTIQGEAQGTTYHIQYISKDPKNYSAKIDSIAKSLDKSLSTYITTSDISKINNGDTTIVIDDYFKEVMKKSAKIYQKTNGEFDPTIGDLVNAWGFGPGKSVENLDSVRIKNLMKYVGFNKVRVENSKIVKEYPETYLDFNGIAQGYLVDLIGRMFEENNIQNYMVEVGGEIRARGANKDGKDWNIAIEYPNEDGTQSFITTVRIHNMAISTSGNYRKFRIGADGKKYAHTINAKTGYATPSNLLSASLISKLDCADVDGYATAFMAMGFERSKVFLKNHPELIAFLIYIDEKGEMQTYKSDNFEN